MKKAKQLVAKATQTFDMAIADVEKANELLVAEIEKEKKTMDAIDVQIETLKAQREGGIDRILNREYEIHNNKALIEKLSQFSAGGTN